MEKQVALNIAWAKMQSSKYSSNLRISCTILSLKDILKDPYLGDFTVKSVDVSLRASADVITTTATQLPGVAYESNTTSRYVKTIKKIITIGFFSQYFDFVKQAILSFGEIEMHKLALPERDSPFLLMCKMTLASLTPHSTAGMTWIQKVSTLAYHICLERNRHLGVINDEGKGVRSLQVLKDYKLARHLRRVSAAANEILLDDGVPVCAACAAAGDGDDGDSEYPNRKRNYAQETSKHLLSKRFALECKTEEAKLELLYRTHRISGACALYTVHQVEGKSRIFDCDNVVYDGDDGLPTPLRTLWESGEKGTAGELEKMSQSKGNRTGESKSKREFRMRIDRIKAMAAERYPIVNEQGLRFVLAEVTSELLAITKVGGIHHETHKVNGNARRVLKFKNRGVPLENVQFEDKHGTIETGDGKGTAMFRGFKEDPTKDRERLQKFLETTYPTFRENKLSIRTSVYEHWEIL